MVAPASTYRLQLHRGFTFDDARRAVPYLEALGVGAAYVSPILASRTGSGHGYDVVDPTSIDPELGTPDDLEALARELADRGMGLVVDTVPNHMAADAENPSWWDVLRSGPGSPFARWFDIDWEAGGGRVILPVLGDLYGRVLEAGELRLALDDDEAVVRYHDRRLPVNDVGHRRLARVRTDLRAAVAHANDTLQLLEEILDAQHYRLAYWRTGARRINYRRFFDITDLVCLRAADPEVFDATHALLLGLVREGLVTGLRIDHVDGLRDPRGYLERLRHHLPEDRSYVVVEKVLEADETLPDDWPAAGTTGYEFLRVVGGLWVDPDGADALRSFTARFTGDDTPFAEVVHDRKRQVLGELFAGEVDRLAEGLRALLTSDRLASDLGVEDLAEAVREVCACLRVYRTYIRDDEVSATDRERIEHAVSQAAERLPHHQAVAARLAGEVLLGERGDPDVRLEWVQRFQQLSGPAMAKGFEDTSLYVWPVLTSRNEVGGDPGQPAVTPEAFHTHNARVLERWPGTLLATSTHDTKRGEDVRTRIDVLSEIPERWAKLVGRWHERHADERIDPREELLCYQTIVGAWDGREDFLDRLKAYTVKAAREAKTHTSWRDPDATREEALEGFCEGVLADRAFVTDLEGLLDVVGPAGVLNSLAQVVLKVASPGVPDTYQGAELPWLRLVDPDNRVPVDLAEHARLLEALDGVDPEKLLDTWRDGRAKLLVTARALRHRRDHAELHADGTYLPLEPRGREKDHVVSFARWRGDGWLCAVVPRLTAAMGPFPRADAWGHCRILLPDGAPDAWEDVLTGTTVRARTRGGGRVLLVGEVFERFPVALLAGGKED